MGYLCPSFLCLDWFHCLLLKLPPRGSVPGIDTTSPSCGFSLLMLEPGDSVLRGAVLYIGPCAASCPHSTHWVSTAPLPPVLATVTIRKCSLGGGQNHQWLRTAILKGRGTLNVNLCLGVPFLPPSP